MKRCWLYVLIISFCFNLDISGQVSRQVVAEALNEWVSNYAAVHPVRVSRCIVKEGVLRVTTNEHLGCVALRRDDVDTLKCLLRKVCGVSSHMPVHIMVGGKNLEDIILPDNVYRRCNVYTSERCEHPWVKRKLPYSLSGALEGRHIAFWASHGYHYDVEKDRWEWQRARLLQTVEDLFTSSFSIPYLVPMLENSGAVVMQPRERDLQTEMLILDNDIPTGGTFKYGHEWKRKDGGYATQERAYLTGENPFTKGSHIVAEAVHNEDDASYVYWMPRVKVSGEYGIYVSYQSYANSIVDAQYEVIHSGDTSHFTINQRMGGGSWVYLGSYYFKKGEACGVRLSNYSAHGAGIVSADAVRFGGGMGNIARGQLGSYVRDSINDCIADSTAHVSGVARWMEGARYYLQWNGVPDSVYVYRAPEGSKYKSNDYTDDLTCRGKWVNYLLKTGVPVDLALALHSDAGVTALDSIIGTLLIYSSKNDAKETIYANGVSREVARELADYIQSEIVNDVRHIFAPEWTRRSLYDKSYSESRVPNVPAVIIELLSHQNYSDMHYGHDPRFKFLVSRSIYKGVLKYLHAQDSTTYCVHPLPVCDFSIQTCGEDELLLRWKARIDSLEPTAIARRYWVQCKVNEDGWDNGVMVDTCELHVRVKQGEHYAFRVMAVNDGGCAFPSEVLRACLQKHAKGCALVVNGFTRTSGPRGFQLDSTYAGFWGDGCGMAYGANVGYVGEQYEFRKDVSWQDDDAPGFGASYGDYEKIITCGNNMDYVGIHGKSIARAGYSYVSCSASVLDSVYDCNYTLVDLILGGQRRHSLGLRKAVVMDSCFSDGMLDYLERSVRQGCNILVSGENVGSDVWEHGSETQRRRLEQLLHYRHHTDHASRKGRVESISNQIHCFGKPKKGFCFHTEPNIHMYAAMHPDGIVPQGDGACSVMRYSENKISAAVAYQGEKYCCCIFGFPIECLTSQAEIDMLLGEVVRFFEQSK